MARESIGRTIIETHCEVEYVDENNDTHSDHVVLYGNYDIYNAANAARRKTGFKRLIVTSVSHVSYYAKMSFEQFAKLSSKTDIKEY